MDLKHRQFYGTEPHRLLLACSRAVRLQIIIIIIINKPDMIMKTRRDNEKETCMLIDVAISGERNVIKKEAEKILKYEDLTLEIQSMWNVKQR